MLDPNFVFVGIFINIIGTAYYIKTTLTGNTKPNKLSFLLISLAPLIAYASQISQGVGLRALPILFAGLMPLSIFIFSFFNKKANWQLNKFDITCGILSVIGLILWKITSIANLAIIFSILSDFLASLPILIKAYKYPQTENALSWLAASFAGLSSLLTIKLWRFEQYAYPLYIFVMLFLIFAFAQFRLGKTKK